MKRLLPIAAVCSFLMHPTLELEACSRLLLNTNTDLILSGRTFDWKDSLGSMIYINPRGMKMNGGTDKTPHSWTSKYGSVTASISTFLKNYGDFTWQDGAIDGLNEKGLAAHALYLTGSKFIEAKQGTPTVETLRWVRYILDNFATVKGAVEGMYMVEIRASLLAGNPMNFHLAIEDATGDSAIVEFINDAMTVKHGKQYSALTNNPPYHEQLKSLKGYQSFGGSKPIPGDITSTDRFVRLHYYSKFLPKTSTPKQAYAQMLSVMQTVSSPFGAPYPSETAYPTWWLSIADLTNIKYFFKSVVSFNMIEIDLKAINFDKASKMRWLDPREEQLSGQVNHAFSQIDELERSNKYIKKLGK